MRLEIANGFVMEDYGKTMQIQFTITELKT